MQRMTRQRAAVLGAIEKQEGFRSAQQVHDDLRAVGDTVGLATVYRNLAALAQMGAVDTLRSPDGEVLYRQCEQSGHHHHLVCQVCGKVKEIAPAKVEKWVSEVGEEHGFTNLSHFVEVFGTCPQCACGEEG